MFRRLLAMNTREREIYLAGRPPEKRQALHAKIQEYLAMDPDARELQLRQTELRWQLILLFNLAPDARAPRLAMVPPMEIITTCGRFSPLGMYAAGISWAWISRLRTAKSGPAQARQHVSEG